MALLCSGARRLSCLRYLCLFIIFAVSCNFKPCLAKPVDTFDILPYNLEAAWFWRCESRGSAISSFGLCFLKKKYSLLRYIKA